MKNKKIGSPEKQPEKPESAGESGVSLPAHSPSPWYTDAGYVRDATNCRILYALSWSHAESDLTLAAAAPELRDALEALVKAYDAQGTMIPALAASRAALAKVRRAQAGPPEPNAIQDSALSGRTETQDEKEGEV